MNDLVFGLICTGAGLIGGILIALVIGTVKRNKKVLNHAGYIILDMRRDSADTISIEGPQNISNWKKYKQLVFDVDILFEDWRQVNGMDTENKPGRNANSRKRSGNYNSPLL